LRKWLLDNGVHNVGFTGISLGGHTAAVSLSCCPDPAPCVAAYCWSSSAGVWTRGALSKRVNFSRLNADYTSNREDYDRFSAEMGSMGLSEWISQGDFPYSDYRLSPECTEMLFTHGENIAARNYTVQLAHFFSHLGNYRRPVDPSLCHFISGRNDLFYGAEKLTSVEKVWPGVQTTFLDVGHVDGFIREGKAYRQIIANQFQRASEADIDQGVISQIIDPVPLGKSDRETGLDLIQKVFNAGTISLVKRFER